MVRNNRRHQSTPFKLLPQFDTKLFGKYQSELKQEWYLDTIRFLADTDVVVPTQINLLYKRKPRKRKSTKNSS